MLPMETLSHSNRVDLNPYHVSLYPEPHLDNAITDYAQKKLEEAKKKLEDVKNAAKNTIAKGAKEIHKRLTKQKEDTDKNEDEKEGNGVDMGNPFFVKLSCWHQEDNLHQEQNDQGKSD